MKNLLLITMIGMTFSAQAGAFKCQDNNGRTVYQETPCESASLKAVGTVKAPDISPEEERVRMMGVEQKYKTDFSSAMEARKNKEKTEKENKDAAYQRSLEERKAAATERQAEAAERDARASEVRNTIKR
ncbi:MAG: DUF4124 domain-containing protein [Sulfuricellaceae bacterium]|nr:DUF4124 domain-containing protein [Sulfuricellaceae bacterium]